MRIDWGTREGEGMAGCFLERRFSKTIWSGADMTGVLIVVRVLEGECIVVLCVL